MSGLDQPGELPLMKELAAPPKRNSGKLRKSPVLQGMSSNTTLGVTLVESCKGNTGEAGGRGKCRRSKRESTRSPQLYNLDSQVSWDLGKDTFFELELKDGTKGWNTVKCAPDGNHSGHGGHADYARLQEDLGNFRANHQSIGGGKPSKKQNAPTLSPLSLNPGDDTQKFSQSKTLFSLEKPHCKVSCYSPLNTSERCLRAEASSVKASPVQGFNLAAGEGSNPDLKHTQSTLPDEAWVHGRKSCSALSKGQNPVKFQLAIQKGRQSAKSTNLPRNHGIKGFCSAPYTGKNIISSKASFDASKGCDGGSSEEDLDCESSRLSTGELHGELDIEASPCVSEHDIEGALVAIADSQRHLQVAVPKSKDLSLIVEEKPRNLSQKYRPRVFEEIVGQSIVSQSLSSAIIKGKIAPVYLFQGPRGTGKTSAARILAAALNCTSLSNNGQRPCGLCGECIAISAGRSPAVTEVDAASNNGLEKVKGLLLLVDESVCSTTTTTTTITTSATNLCTLSRIAMDGGYYHHKYRLFIIDECHAMATETWNALLKVLEEPPVNVVFILITTDPDQLPRTVISRCQRFPFPKIKDCEIVKRLERLASLENLGFDSKILQLIASRSDGSLRDAETTLDQLSLLGCMIDHSTVYELVGSASDEKMVKLLDSALVADTVNTVRRVRDLIDAGVEPLTLMSRLATLIMDILAGSYKFTDDQMKGFFRRKNLSEDKLERLRKAIKTLSEAEKQLRASNDKTTWLTAALLQLGPERPYLFPASAASTGTSMTQSPVAHGNDGVVDTEAVNFQRSIAKRHAWYEEATTCQEGLSSPRLERPTDHEMFFASLGTSWLLVIAQQSIFAWYYQTTQQQIKNSLSLIR